MAKQKMTKAQAAAARHEPTANSIAKKKAQEEEQIMREQRRLAQKQANKSVGFRFVVPFVFVIVIIVLSLVFTIGPGMVTGN
ncbi:MAG: hypothetical protein IJ087_06885 [Eggerthellaceae bacterium]|nr:hypothetical protein [Eggerthellaceae bacterium]